MLSKPSDPARLSFFSAGRRPADQLFFIGGTLWSALAMGIWTGVVAGWWDFVPVYGPVPWHAHELLFGYIGAIIGGFLLTAIPNWSGRLPIGGVPLLGMFLLWLAGRTAMAGNWIGTVPAIIVDCAFLVTLTFVVLREIVLGRNWRNVKTVALLFLLAATNIGFHAEIIYAGAPEYSQRAAIAVIVGLIAMIGGRIVPRFSLDWLTAAGSSRLPTVYDGFDTVCLLVAVVALVLWTVAPDWQPTGWTLIVAGIIHAVRMSRWAGLSTWPEPLLFVLHVAYAFVPLGFLAVGVSIPWPEIVPAEGAVHIWTAGAMAMMPLAVMTRAGLGHAGRELKADGATVLIYAAAGIAVLARFSASLVDEFAVELLTISAITWVLAFAVFLLRYGAMLAGMRSSD